MIFIFCHIMGGLFFHTPGTGSQTTFLVKKKNVGCLKEFTRAWPSGTPSGKGLYLSVYPSSRPNTDTVQSNTVPQELGHRSVPGWPFLCLFLYYD